MLGVKVNRQTREVVERGTYPRFDGAPIQDMDPMYEWLIVYEPFPKSQYNYDPRYYSFVENENASASLGDHPSYPGVGQFLKTYSLIKNSTIDILNCLESAENDANSTLMPTTKQLKHIVIAINAIRKISQGINLQPYESTVLTRINTYANKIASNYALAAQKEAQINSGNEPDLDSDWIRE